jgi:hypothetical protein
VPVTGAAPLNYSRALGLQGCMAGLYNIYWHKRRVTSSTILCRAHSTGSAARTTITSHGATAVWDVPPIIAARPDALPREEHPKGRDCDAQVKYGRTNDTYTSRASCLPSAWSYRQAGWLLQSTRVFTNSDGSHRQWIQLQRSRRRAVVTKRLMWMRASIWWSPCDHIRMSAAVLQCTQNPPVATNISGCASLEKKKLPLLLPFTSQPFFQKQHRGDFKSCSLLLQRCLQSCWNWTRGNKTVDRPPLRMFCVPAARPLPCR